MDKNNIKSLVITFFIGVVIGFVLLFDTCRSPVENLSNSKVDSLIAIINKSKYTKDSLVKLTETKTAKIDSLKDVKSKVEVKYKYVKQNGVDIIPSIVCDTVKLIENYNNLALYCDSAINANHLVIDYQDSLILHLKSINMVSDSIISNLNLVRNKEKSQCEITINDLKKEAKKGKIKSFIKGVGVGVTATALIISSILIFK